MSSLSTQGEDRFQQEHQWATTRRFLRWLRDALFDIIGPLLFYGVLIWIAYVLALWTNRNMRG